MAGYEDALEIVRNTEPNSITIHRFMDTINHYRDAVLEHPDDPYRAMDLADALTMGFNAFANTGFGGLLLLYMLNLPVQLPDTTIDIWEQHAKGKDSRLGFLKYYCNFKIERT